MVSYGVAIKPGLAFGQLFTEWQVRLTSSCLDGLCTGGGSTLRVFVNGQAYADDPAALPLTAQQEIELVYAPINATITPVPQDTFPEGLGEFNRSLQHPFLMRGVERVVQDGTDRQAGRVLGPDGRRVDFDRGL